MSRRRAGRRRAPSKSFAAGKTLPEGGFTPPSGSNKAGSPWDWSHGADPGGIVSGLRELGYTVELAP